jgi:hypothetical protein
MNHSTPNAGRQNAIRPVKFFDKFHLKFFTNITPSTFINENFSMQPFWQNWEANTFRKIQQVKQPVGILTTTF